MGALNRFCHRAMLLERGSLVHIGEPQEVADRYLEINFGRDRGRGRAGRRGARGDGEARVVEAWIEDEQRRAPGLGRAAGPAAHAQGAGAGSWSTSRTPARACTCSTRTTSPSSSRSTAREHERSGRFGAGEEARVLVLVRQRARAGPLQPAVHARPPRHRAWTSWTASRARSRSSSRGSEADGRDGGPARSRSGSAASQIRPTTRPTTQGPAHEHRDGPRRGAGRPAVVLPRGSRAPDPRPEGAHQRLARFWHLTYNIARNECKLRFFGSALGYLVAADAPAAAVRRAVRVLHQDRARRPRPGPERGTSTARSCSARSCCSRSSPRPPPGPCAASWTARTSCARSSSRAW